jgi:predicted TIM-barrel fold metal-dependent hydrolase
LEASYSVERAIFYGEGKPGEFTKVIWMPTFSASTDIVFNRRAVTEKVEVLRDGHVVPELIPIFDLIAKYNLVLATGHLGEEEALAVVQAARQHGVSKIVLTHPWGVVPGISIDGQKRAVELGAMLEICYVDTTDYYKTKYGHSLSNKEIVNFVREVGPEAILLSTDLGADSGENPLPAVGMGLFIEALLHQGLSEKEVDIMSKKNPAALLGLDFNTSC